MGSQRSHTRTSRRVSYYLIRIRHVPGPKDAPSGPFYYRFRWFSYRTWLCQYVPTYCRSNPNRFWIRYGFTSELRSK
jgi:hypothetical protein